MAQEPIDSKGLEALILAMQRAVMPLIPVFEEFGAAMAQAFGAMDGLRVAEEERQRKALMARVTWWTWRVVVGVVSAALTFIGLSVWYR